MFLLLPRYKQNQIALLAAAVFLFLMHLSVTMSNCIMNRTQHTCIKISNFPGKNRYRQSLAYTKVVFCTFKRQLFNDLLDGL